MLFDGMKYRACLSLTPGRRPACVRPLTHIKHYAKIHKKG